MNNSGAVRWLILPLLLLTMGIMGTRLGSNDIEPSLPPLLMAPVVVSEPLPDLSDETDISQKKQRFFDAMNPLVQLENRQILKIRAHLEALSSGKVDQKVDQLWLQQLATRYRVSGCKQNWSICIDKLLLQVDVIPPSLVLAQAANESAWGSSRFARLGNNIFGQWCFSRGCGLVPEGREAGQKYEVKVFSSVQDSIRSYMLNLNVHRSYAGLRSIRAKEREQENDITGVKLAQGLQAYSQRGRAYVDELVNMIQYNNLDQLDNQIN